jgi:hypothetical protein
MRLTRKLKAFVRVKKDTPVLVGWLGMLGVEMLPHRGLKV